MHVIENARRALMGLTLMVPLLASADVVQVRGTVTVPYSTGLFSSGPDAASNKAALGAAKRAAWDIYTSRFNDAKMKTYLANKERFTGNIDEYVKDLTIVDQQTDATSHTLRVAVRANINETAVDVILNSTSEASHQGSGNGSTLVFVFLAREVTKSKSFDARVAKVERVDSSRTSMEKAADSDDVEATGSRSSDMKEVTYGGSVERKRAETVYDVTSPEDVTAAMSDVLSTSGFEIAAYDDVVANCGGVDRNVVMKEFGASDDMTMQTRRSMIGASRQCGASLFATGTIDVGVQDTDPVTGNKRVYVSVRGQVWDIRQALPRKVASVGPVQFQGLGPDESVARRNALNLASRNAAKTLVDQLNAKQIH